MLKDIRHKTYTQRTVIYKCKYKIIIASDTLLTFIVPRTVLSDEGISPFFCHLHSYLFPPLILSRTPGGRDYYYLYFTKKRIEAWSHHSISK